MVDPRFSAMLAETARALVACDRGTARGLLFTMGMLLCIRLVARGEAVALPAQISVDDELHKLRRIGYSTQQIAKASEALSALPELAQYLALVRALIESGVPAAEAPPAPIDLPKEDGA